MDTSKPAPKTGTRTTPCPRCSGPRLFVPYPSGLHCITCGNQLQVQGSMTAAEQEATSAEVPADHLGERDLAMLELERSWWKHPGAKDSTIRERFDLSPTQYYAAINRLLDRPEALAADPLLVKRLRRLREARRELRSGRRAFV